MTVRIINADVLDGLRSLPDDSVHCCVTSPPYWGLRDYGVAGQIGLEPTPDAFVARLVDVFREVRRVLRKDGTCWVNLGDSYNSGNSGGLGGSTLCGGQENQKASNRHGRERVGTLKPKDLIGIPWRVAFALQADGWWLRQDIIWHKPNPMPESVADRCTKAHEYVFFLTKNDRYRWDADAIAEATIRAGDVNDYTGNQKNNSVDPVMQATRPKGRAITVKETRNKRSVWTIATAPFAEAHFATFPPELPEICIKAGCPKGGTVLDPFCGAGTTGLVADRLQRNAILIELNPEYAAMADRGISADRGGLLDAMELAAGDK
jgi:DNA modification methylase